MSFRKEKAIELVNLAQTNERLAHAYLLTGPPGSGKREVAIRLAEMTFPAGTPPVESIEDLRSPTIAVVGPGSSKLYDRNPPKKGGKTITIGAIRGIEHILQLASEPDVTKFAIIESAHTMGEGAENAFLKTLEEPPARCRLILISSKPEQLLDTILSRCIRIDLLGQTGPAAIDPSLRPFLDSMSRYTLSSGSGVTGALGLVSGFSSILKLEKDKISGQNDAAFKEEVAKFQKTTEGSYIREREEYYRAMGESQYLQRRNQLLEYLVMWFGDAMRQQNGGKHLDLPDFTEATSKLAQSLSADELCRRIDTVDQLRSNLNTNVTEALAIEVAFIKAFQ